jgi:hypothetical protein
MVHISYHSRRYDVALDDKAMYLPPRDQTQGMRSTFGESTVHWLHFSTLSNYHVLIRLVAGGTGVLNLVHDVHAVNDLTKHDVFVVEKWGWHSGDEELAAVGVWAGVLGTQISDWRWQNLI